jgi:hypothetical protein
MWSNLFESDGNTGAVASSSRWSAKDIFFVKIARSDRKRKLPLDTVTKTVLLSESEKR